jgi:hypothetical protein
MRSFFLSKRQSITSSQCKAAIELIRAIEMKRIAHKMDEMRWEIGLLKTES